MKNQKNKEQKSRAKKNNKEKDWVDKWLEFFDY